MSLMTKIALVTFVFLATILGSNGLYLFAAASSLAAIAACIYALYEIATEVVLFGVKLK
jgi:hypothetical protein